MAGTFPKALWAEALETANYLSNVSPTKRNFENMSPYQLRFGKLPPTNHFRRFGCIAWAHIDSERRSKLSARAVKCMFVGYPSDQKGYRLLTVDSLTPLISRNVVFIENELATIPDKLPQQRFILEDESSLEHRVLDEKEMGEMFHEVQLRHRHENHELLREADHLTQSTQSPNELAKGGADVQSIGQNENETVTEMEIESHDDVFMCEPMQSERIQNGETTEEKEKEEDSKEESKDLIPGMPVQITQNVRPKKGAANGTTGVLHSTSCSLLLFFRNGTESLAFSPSPPLDTRLFVQLRRTGIIPHITE